MRTQLKTLINAASATVLLGAPVSVHASGPAEQLVFDSLDGTGKRQLLQIWNKALQNSRCISELSDSFPCFSKEEIKTECWNVFNRDVLQMNPQLKLSSAIGVSNTIAPNDRKQQLANGIQKRLVQIVSAYERYRKNVILARTSDATGKIAESRNELRPLVGEDALKFLDSQWTNSIRVARITRVEGPRDINMFQVEPSVIGEPVWSHDSTPIGPTEDQKIRNMLRARFEFSTGHYE